MLLSVENLQVQFGRLQALAGVSFSVNRGEVLGLVGESGSGKSLSAMAVMGLLPLSGGRVSGGSIHFDGTDLGSLSAKAYRKIRGGKVALVTQNPMTSLDPVVRVGQQIDQAALLHLPVDKTEAKARTLALMERLRIPNAEMVYTLYPHQLSGGLRQRIVIAMALAGEPDLLIADEPTTALDVTIQAQILDLMRRLQRDFGMSILFITHNLGVVCDVADRVAVMYGGRIVETAETRTLFKSPGHPYTRGLLASVPRLEDGESGHGKRLYAIPGTVPSPLIRQTGCTFASRCDRLIEACRTAVPPLEEVSSAGAVTHSLRCIRWRDADVAAAVR